MPGSMFCGLADHVLAGLARKLALATERPMEGALLPLFQVRKLWLSGHWVPLLALSGVGRGVWLVVWSAVIDDWLPKLQPPHGGAWHLRNPQLIAWGCVAAQEPTAHCLLEGGALMPRTGPSRGRGCLAEPE